MNTKKLLPLTVLALALPFAACGGGGTEATTTADKAPASPKVEQAEPVKAEPVAKPKPKKVKHLPALAQQVKPAVIAKMDDGSGVPIKIKSADCIKKAAVPMCTVAVTGDAREGGKLVVSRLRFPVEIGTGKVDWKSAELL